MKMSVSRWMVSALFVLTQVAFAGPSAGVPLTTETIAKPKAVSSGEEAWKGKSDPSEFSLGFLAGLGLVDSHAGFSLIGTVSRKILEPGFAPDINNGVSIELAAGPWMAASGATLFYSTHLRWDFRKTSDWGLYAIGGLGGFLNSDKIGVPFEFFPRFGVGMLWRVHSDFTIRAEASHELVAVGMLFPF